MALYLTRDALSNNPVQVLDMGVGVGVGVEAGPFKPMSPMRRWTTQYSTPEASLMAGF